MAQSNIINTFSAAPVLMPAIHPEHALKSVFPVMLPPSVSYGKGNLLVPGTGTAASDVQTITPPGSATFTLTGINPVTGVSFTTAAIAYNASASAIQAALVAALGMSLVTVSGTVVTWSGAAANMPVYLMTSSNGSVAHTTTGSAANVHTLYTGSGTPTCWLKQDCSTDAYGMVTFGLNGGIGDQQGGKLTYAPAYFSGCFYEADLPNVDSNALSVMNAAAIGAPFGQPGCIVKFP